MSFFTHNLIHVVSYQRAASATPNVNGDVTFGATASAAAKVIGKVQNVKDADGNERVSMHCVYTEAEIKIGDLIWVAFLGDTVGTLSHARRPITIQRSPALRGDSTLFAVYL